ncbi:MAG: hypothetical protein II892_03710 [Fibrobacter sp.]|nr:hypothetical protein [Fibrobacter sp.]
MLKAKHILPMGAILFGLVGCNEMFDTANAVPEGSINIDGTGSNGNAALQGWNPPSSSSALDGPGICLWDGGAKQVFVATGFSGANAGLWWNFNDSEVGGTSNIIWPMELENPYDDPWSLVLSNNYGCIAGTASLHGELSNMGYAGVGFVVAEQPVGNGSAPVAADISGWNGLCVTYASDHEMFLELDNGNETVLVANLESDVKMVEKCIAWDDFINVSSNANASNRAIAGEISAVKFVMKSTTDTDVNFRIAAVGTYSAGGSCHVDLSRIENAGMIPIGQGNSAGSEFDLWLGSDDLYRVDTRLCDESATCGYWFPVENTESGEPSRITWPVSKGDEYDSESLSPIIDYCGGLCGALNFENKGFAGVGFSIVNKDEIDGSMKPADITSWGGLCVKYTSSLNIDVVMNGAAYENSPTLLQSPMVTLPSSDSLTTKCVEWDEFGAGASSHVTSLLFVAEGGVGTEGNFNIVGLGTLANN